MTIEDFIPRVQRMQANRLSIIGGRSLVTPFVMVRVSQNSDVITPVWLMMPQKDPLLRINWHAFGQPISEHQCLERWMTLQVTPLCCGMQTRIANMIGLRELIARGNLAEGDGGECFRIIAESGGRTFEGVFAESIGAARRTLNAICDATGHDEKMREVNPGYQRDWNGVTS